MRLLAPLIVKLFFREPLVHTLAGNKVLYRKDGTKRIADNAPFSNYLMIQAISRVGDMSRQDGLFTESLAAAMSQTTSGAAEGLRAFLEKRPPKFRDF